MIPDNIVLVSFDMVNMYPNIGNNRDLAASRDALDTMVNQSPSTNFIIKGLEIFVVCNNLEFGSKNLLQLSDTATGAPNFCLYSESAINIINKI